jgi:hypothetical protein
MFSSGDPDGQNDETKELPPTLSMLADLGTCASNPQLLTLAVPFPIVEMPRAPEHEMASPLAFIPRDLLFPRTVHP